MIWDAVPPDAVAGTAQALVEDLARGPTISLGLTKAALLASATATLDDQFEREAASQAQSAQTDDYEEGVRAFLGKRPPVFRGH